METTEENIEELYRTLKRNLNLMRELDDQIDDQLIKFIKNTSVFIKDKENRSFEDMQNFISKNTQILHKIDLESQEKLNLSMQSYETTDQSINFLEEQIARAETSIKLGEISPSTPLSHLTMKQLLTPKEIAARKISHSAEIPIDPNEPTYCYCKEVSYGEMVACDDDNCEIEWFHIECVNLKAPPKGSWYCKDCLARRKHR
ncbi:hypothetical protein CONCODRAFT_70254 [Conidiobolus coronatus NRRL 28638]|uniref:Chromatin modification-related protein n=1 Tax=Conidiobolus coronatus (strain ATCC 28846 / CBS 209.66 / NRRL 28638) TaxID=796925 RepID=A0A137P7L6_CONC2|nr:hypothetical protein CONCODRAFT_70254 [Conidiobolus coronatus NRRL 28638]|eukprot:KXN70934.1 hypothetical protein CONCODRAFT_70254 [Conidiobolus coronatus NRRL 28638]